MACKMPIFEGFLPSPHTVPVFLQHTGVGGVGPGLLVGRPLGCHVEDGVRHGRRRCGGRAVHGLLLRRQGRGHGRGGLHGARVVVRRVGRRRLRPAVVVVVVGRCRVVGGVAARATVSAIVVGRLWGVVKIHVGQLFVQPCCILRKENA